MRADCLEARIAEVLMSALSPCDLGDGIEVVHETETLEVEMECSFDDETLADDELGTQQFVRSVGDDLATHQFVRDEDLGTHQFVRFSAPYERIEVQIDASAFRRATIEEAKRLHRRNRNGEASNR